MIINSTLVLLSLIKPERKKDVGNKPKVSVIIPYYKGEKFIAKAIESVLNQTYQNFEIVIVDDVPTDNIMTVLEPYITDSKVKLVQHERNKGIPSARNTGIKHSTGKYIAFLDQDDLWFPQKLECQVAVFERASTDLGLVFSKMDMIDSEGIVEKCSPAGNVPSQINNLSLREVLKALFLNGNFVPIITVLVRRECITTTGLFDETIRGGADDYEFCLRVATKYKVEYLDIPLAAHRIHSTNYSNAERFFKDDLRITDKVLAQVPSLAPLRKKRLALVYYNLGRHYQLDGMFHHARSALWKAIKYHPLRSKPFLALLLSLCGRLGNWLSRVYRVARIRVERDGT